MVEQQAKLIRMHSDLNVGEYADLKKLRRKSTSWWQSQIVNNHVFVMPGEVLSYVLARSYLSVSQTNLLVFDECHLAVDDHAYVDIMNSYHNTAVDSHPRVLGLTSSILTGKCMTPEALEQNLCNLEKCLDSVAETATDMVVADLNGAKPREVLIECEKYEDKTGLMEQLEDILESAVIFLQVCIPLHYPALCNIIKILDFFCTTRIIQNSRLNPVYI